MFGTLASRPARVLGLMSYSIYLTHYFFSYLGFRLINHFTQVSGLSVCEYWTTILVIGAVTVGVSALTFRHVEFGFLALSKKKLAPTKTFSISAGVADNS